MSTTTSDFLRHLRTLAARQAIGGLSDQQLLERFRLERSEASFAVLVQRHGPMVLSVCRRVLHHAQDAEDAFQATFLVLAKKAALLRQPPLLGGWLHGVAYHVARRLKAKMQRCALHEQRVGPPPGEARDDITWRELRAVLDEELQRLPEKHRAPLVLCYLEGRTQDEAARLLGWSKSTFRRRLECGRKRLGSQLARRGITLSAALTVPLLIDAAATASVPPLLAATTVRAGLASALGNTVSGIVSDQVVALAESGVGSLLVKKASIAFVLLVSLSLGLGGLLAQRAAQSRTFAEVLAAPPAQSPPARSASKEQVIEIKGRVLGPDDKPVAGAGLLVFSWSVEKDDLKVSATTGDDGRFRLSVPAGEIRRGAKLVALARDLGPDWAWIDGRKNADSIMLRLVPDDVPIAGRVLDLEGRPVSGASVGVAWVDNVDLKAWLADPKPVDLFSRKTKNIRPAALGVPISVTTDKDGRFRLTGFGRDRIAHLQIRGAGIENNDIEVMARTGNLHGLRLESRTVYASGSTIVVRPSKPIVGTIRDKKTGKPIAGISVVHPDATYNWARAKTDAKGHYRLEGVGKKKEYHVSAGELPYFNCTKLDIADTLGLEPITVDFALERGIAVRGKLLDKITGKPIRGQVHYVALPDNPNLKDFTDINKPQALGANPGQTKADGAFTVVAIPGPGLLLAKANASGNYLTAALPEPKPPVGNILEGYHAIVRINPSEEKPQSATQDLYLEPAQTVDGIVVGSDSKPLPGAYYAGLTGTLDPNFFQPPTMDTASFTVGGIGPKRTRNIVFIHAEKKLAKIQPIDGDTAKPLTVRLEPLGAIRGRILDAAGRPRAGLKLTIQYSNQKSDYQDLPLELMYFAPQWSKILYRQATTDAEGRFHADGLVPGLKYFLVEEHEPEIFCEPLARGIALESGKTKDLGDLKSKPIPEK